MLPATLPVVLRGVSGGVVIGNPVTLPELAAVSPGTLPPIRVGGFVRPPPGPPPGAAEACVMIDEVELDRAGDEGRWFTKVAAGGGEGAAKELLESRCRCAPPSEAPVS